MGNMQGFNANEHEPSRDFEPIPAGAYRAQITESEQRDIGNNGSSGWKFTLTWQVMEGPHTGRLIWQDLLVGYSAQGEKADKTRLIANSQMGDICRATGKLTPDDTSELHYVPCDITVGFGKQNTNPQTGQPYPPRNEVKSVKTAGGVGRGAPPARGAFNPPAQEQRQPPSQSSAPPARQAAGGWNRPAR